MFDLLSLSIYRGGSLISKTVLERDVDDERCTNGND